jgi:tRNA dimethylallyltransferase
MTAADPRHRPLLLLGPTASGKSALAMQLAQQLMVRYARTVELISIDSAQVYRGMDIGSAKPDAAEQAAVRHHLIDIRDPAQAYSAADFIGDAIHATRQILARGNLPLIVGGTMMYARALRDGLADLPSADPHVRARLEAEAAEHGWPALHQRLQQLDPLTAQRLAPGDRQRIGRALEVLEVSGKPLSEWFATAQHASLSVRTVVLQVNDRARLHQRIAERFDQMIDRGLLDEVRGLRQRADLHPDLPSIRCVGYRQAWEYLSGVGTQDEFRERGIAATRQLAKRQITWIRSMSNADAIDPFGPDPLAELTQVASAEWRLS